MASKYCIARARSKANGEIVEGLFIEGANLICPIGACIRVYPDSVHLYTGCDDATDQKIFDGDTIEVSDEKSVVTGCNFFRVIFDHHTGTFCLVANTDGVELTEDIAKDSYINMGNRDFRTKYDK